MLRTGSGRASSVLGPAAACRGAPSFVWGRMCVVLCCNCMCRIWTWCVCNFCAAGTFCALGRVVRLIKSSWIIEFHLKPLSPSPWQPAPREKHSHTHAITVIQRALQTQTRAQQVHTRVRVQLQESLFCQTNAPSGLCALSPNRHHSWFIQES